LQVHTFNKACAAVYPSVVQNNILWFWPNTNPDYKDILEKEKPPYVPELDDPSYSCTMGTRDLHYGYVHAQNFTALASCSLTDFIPRNLEKDCCLVNCFYYSFNSSCTFSVDYHIEIDYAFRIQLYALRHDQYKSAI